ncbi:MAG: hypothetical protein ACK45H_08600 [Bacteroidota bacterium]|jgi:hypothetical protein
MNPYIKKSALHLGILLIASAFVAFNMQKTQNSIALGEALAAGKITAHAATNGTYSGKGIQLSLANKTSSEMHLLIPAGTLFNPENKEEQELITTQDELLVLQPRSQTTATLTVNCIEADDRCPSQSGKCSIGKVSDPKLIKLIAELRNYKLSSSTVQDAIWAVTDNRPLSNIDRTTPAEERIRTFVAALTGQKDVWYSTPQNRTVDNSGNIVSETVTIRGNISYTANKGMQVYNEVVKENGTRIHKTEIMKAPINGKVEFTFTLRVKGWEKGNYLIKVKEGDRVIADYPFSI